MTALTIFLLAFALAMDAFAVAITTGIQLRVVTTAQTLRMSGAFGAFQCIMPICGWFAGLKAQRFIESYDHWVAFALLAVLGGKMIWEALHAPDAEDACAAPAADPTAGGKLIMLAVATSLDALAVGLSMAVLGQSVWEPAIVIGVVCFCLTAAGMHLGRCACRLPLLSKLGDKANIFGGAVLLLIGCNILREHGVFV